MATPSKLIVFLLLVIIGFSSTCTATTYLVGDNSGWDISTDLGSWTTGKQFYVGDVLAFQYSSTHSVSKVKKENYERCNTSNVLESSSNGNTSFTLTQPGDTYFICGNRLHCLGGMKLHVVTQGQGDSPAASPSLPPQSTGGGGGGGGSSLPQPSSKSNIPSTSAAMFYHVTMLECVSMGFFGFVFSSLIF